MELTLSETEAAFLRFLDRAEEWATFAGLPDEEIDDVRDIVFAEKLAFAYETLCTHMWELSVDVPWSEYVELRRIGLELGEFNFYWELLHPRMPEPEDEPAAEEAQLTERSRR